MQARRRQRGPMKMIQGLIGTSTFAWSSEPTLRRQSDLHYAPTIGYTRLIRAALK